MDEKLDFAIDLYQGTAEYYDRYRLSCHTATQTASATSSPATVPTST